MTDIVAELERLADGYECTYKHAAEEIKQLRAELASYKKEDAIKASANKMLLDEVERMRANWEGCADTCSRLHKAIKVLEDERDALRALLEESIPFLIDSPKLTEMKVRIRAAIDAARRKA